MPQRPGLRSKSAFVILSSVWRTGRASVGRKSLFMKRELFFFLPLHSEDKQYEVRWLFKPTNATWATSRGGRKVPRSVYECGAVHTLVWRQLWEEPVAAAPDGDEGSSSLDSFCSSLWRPRLMWLCRAAGVNHSLGRQLCRKGMHELKYASLLTQRGISRPHSNWENAQYVTWNMLSVFYFYQRVRHVKTRVRLERNCKLNQSKWHFCDLLNDFIFYGCIIFLKRTACHFST